MTRIVSSKGIEKDIDLDVDKMMEFEDQDPSWSIVTLTERLDRLRMHDVDQLVRCFGFDGVNDYLAQGFNIRQINQIIKGSKILGFTPGTDSDPQTASA